MVPNPVDDSTREQIGSRGASFILNFNRLLKVLDKFPKQRAAAARLEPLESLALTLDSSNEESHAVIKLRLHNKEINALRQMVEMGTSLPTSEEDSSTVEEEKR